METKKSVKKTNNNTAKKVASAVGTAGRVAVATTAVVAHAALSFIGAILCAVTKDV